MAQAYIVDAVRTAGGKRGGKLAGWHPVDMAAAVLDAIVERTGIDGAAVDDVVMGCVMQGGQQAVTASPRSKIWRTNSKPRPRLAPVMR